MATLKNTAADKVTNYIESLPEWSKQLCKKLRKIILAADASLQEEWKWGPHYASKGMVCGYGAFQKHVKLTFFNGCALQDKAGLFNHCVYNEFSRSIKYTHEDEINEGQLTNYIKESVAVNNNGFKREVKNKTVQVPEELRAALQKNKKAWAFFETLSYGYKKEFAEYITTAKQEQTRKTRIDKVVLYCSEGKKLNDRYKPISK